MSKNQGIAVHLDGAVYFIPSEELAAYRIPDAAAGALRDDLCSIGDDVAGFAAPGARVPFEPLKAAFGVLPSQVPVPRMGYTSQDFITFTRVK